MKIHEFWQDYAGQAFELIDGKICPIPDKGYAYELTSSRILKLLEVHVETYNLGTVLGTGVRWGITPYDLRTIDVAFLSGEQLSAITDPDAYISFAPLLAVEVIHPRITSLELQAKIDLLLDFGTPLLWLADSERREITVFTGDGAVGVLSEGEALAGMNILPGMNLMVDDCFPPLNLHLSYP